MRVYLDSCVVIYLVEKREPWCTRIRRGLLPEEAPLPEVCFTDLTRMECRVGPVAKDDTDALAEYDKFFAAPQYQHVSMNTLVFDLATDFRAHHQLKTPDALHLAAALNAGCDAFWTNDRRLESTAKGRITVVKIDDLP
jgi:predicted nucleic acid-binding protein